MNKRGLSYVDWVISLGTFLIAVLLIFVLIRPQIGQKDQGPTLLNLIEQQFYDETEWTVRETPIFVKHVDRQYVDNNGVTRLSNIFVHYDPSFEFTTPSITAALQVTPNNPLVIQCVSSTCDNEKITFITSPRQVLSNDLPQLSLDCSPSGSASICDATLGATASTQGINQRKVETLKTQGYTPTKQQWKYPTLNDFAIYIDDVSMFTNPPTPPPQANVYVKERTYWYLDKQNRRTTINIRFQAW
jgi:hypothetical protein